jgi:hypothetical protein
MEEWMPDSTEITADPPKRPYQTPELRDLGTIAEATQANTPGPGAFDGSTYGS